MIPLTMEELGTSLQEKELGLLLNEFCNFGCANGVKSGGNKKIARESEGLYFRQFTSDSRLFMSNIRDCSNKLTLKR